MSASRATNDFSRRWVRELFYIIMRLTFNNKFPAYKLRKLNNKRIN